MLKIYPGQINRINFGSNEVDNPQNITKPDGLKQINKLPEVTADYNVKTPMSYAKTGILNLPNGISAECYKLANGQRVVIVPKKGKTTINTIVNTGSMNEPDNLRGISHYIEHNLFNGSEGLEAGEFFKRVNNMGGSTNAATGFATTNYFITSNLLNEDDFEQMVKIHLAMLETPKFSDEALTKEKPIVQSEINMITQEPSNLSANRAIKNLYQIKSTSQDMIGGTVDNIENLSREDILKYYNDNYYPANMVTVITGEVTEKEAIELVSKYAKSKKIPSKPQLHQELNPIEKSIREDFISDKAHSTSMTIALNGPKNKDLKDKIALDIALNELFSGGASRINSKLIDFGTSISVMSDKISSDRNANSVLLFDCNSNDDNVELALKVLYDEIGKLNQAPINEERLNEHKKIIYKSYLEAFESNGAINSGLASMLLEYDTNSIQNYENILNSVTVDDVKNAVKKYLDTERASIVVTHPAESDEESINASYSNAATVSFAGRADNKKRIVTDLSKIEDYTFPNNVKLTLNNSNSDLAYVSYNLASGSKNEKYDLESMILDEMLNKGSVHQNAIQIKQELDKDAISFDIGASNGGIAVGASCWAQDVDKVFDKALDIIYSPNFSEENFNKIKNNLKEQISSIEPNAMRKINREIYPYSIKGMSKEEIMAKLEGITLDDIKNFYSKLISEGQGIVTVTGPRENREFKNNLFNSIIKMPETQPFTKTVPSFRVEPNDTKVFTEVFNRPQAKIVEAFTYEASPNLKDTTTVALLNTILGGNPSSRLFMDLREKQQLAYRVSSSNTIKNDLGIMKLTIGTTTDDKDAGIQTFDNVQKSIDGFNKNIKLLMNEKVSDEELNNAKLTLKNAILSAAQTPFEETAQLTVSQKNPYGFNYNNLALEMIDEITSDDILQAANHIFSNKPMYSILATKDTLNANADYLKSLEINGIE